DNRRRRRSGERRRYNAFTRNERSARRQSRRDPEPDAQGAFGCQGRTAGQSQLANGCGAGCQRPRGDGYRLEYAGPTSACNSILVSIAADRRTDVEEPSRSHALGGSLTSAHCRPKRAAVFATSDRGGIAAKKEKWYAAGKAQPFRTAGGIAAGKAQSRFFL